MMFTILANEQRSKLSECFDFFLQETSSHLTDGIFTTSNSLHFISFAWNFENGPHFLFLTNRLNNGALYTLFTYLDIHTYINFMSVILFNRLQSKVTRYTCIYANIHIYIYIYIYVYIYTHTYIYLDIYIYTYICNYYVCK